MSELNTDLLQQILDTIRGIDARVNDLEVKYDELTSVDPEDFEKDSDDEEDGFENEQPTTDDYLSAIGDALQTLMQMMQEVLSRMNNEPGNFGNNTVQSEELYEIFDDMREKLTLIHTKMDELLSKND